MSQVSWLSLDKFHWLMTFNSSTVLLFWINGVAIFSYTALYPSVSARLIKTHNLNSSILWLEVRGHGQW